MKILIQRGKTHRYLVAPILYTNLKIRKEVLQEKREAEAQARRDAIERQELTLTLAGVFFLLTASAIGATAYLHHMGWIDFWDYFK